jgi:hypothetical protein
VYEELLAIVLERSATLPRPSKARGKRRPPEAPSLSLATANCPVCDWDWSTEELYLSNLLDGFDDAEFASRYRESCGVCLPHLQMALDERADHAKLPLLVQAEREKLEALGAELQEFIRKHDYRYADEPKGREQTSWTRVVEKFVGQREMVNR